jgi:hypothetical protein
MARTLQITCDQCGKVKAQANHWWIGRFNTDDPAAGGLFIMLLPIDETAPVGDDHHLCGEECVQKFVAQKMREMK